MATSSRSSMTDKVHDPLILLNISSSSYDSLLSDIYDICAYLNELLISLSSDLEKTRTELFEVKNKVEEKNTRIMNLNLKLTNVTLHRDSVKIL